MRGVSGGTLTSLLLFLLAPTVSGNGWDFTPSVSLREIYSDNIGLSEDDPQSDWVTELTPGFNLRGSNDWLKLNMTASSQNLYYRDAAVADGDHFQSNPQLQLQSTSTLVPNFFFIDLGGNAGQRLVSSGTRGSYDNIALSGDQADYYSYSVAPYIRYRSRAGISFEARAERGVSEFDRDSDALTEDLNDTVSENYRVRLDNSAMVSQLHWSLSGSRRYLDRQASDLIDPDYRSSQLDVSYQVSGTWSLIGRAGRTENTLGGFDTERNGNYSAGGFRWTPNRRFNMSAMTGDRYSDTDLNWQPSRRTNISLGYRDTDIGVVSGPSWRANVRFRGRRLSSTLSYNEEVTNEQQIVLDGELLLPILDPDGNIVVDPVTLLPILIRVPNYVLANDEFERHRGVWTVTWKGRRGNINLSVNREQRRYLLRQELDNDSIGAALNLSWPVAGGVSLLAQYREQQGEFISDGGEEDFRLASLGLRFDLSSRSYASLTVQQVDQDSARGFRSYEEGRVIAELNMRF